MDVSWKVAIKVWFSFLWRTIAFSVLIGIIVGIFFALIDVGGAIMLHERSITAKFRPFIIWASMIPVQIIAIKGALKAEYSDFHISLVDIKQGFSKKVLIKSPS